MKKWTTLILYSGIFTVLLRNFLVYYIGAITPGYHPFFNFISELSAEGTPHATLMNTGSLILLGIVLILTAKALNQSIQGPGSWLPMGYLAIAGAGFILIGLFPCPPGCLPELDTTQMTIHLLAAFVATFSMSTSALAYGLWSFKGYRSHMRMASLVLGSIGILAFIGLWGSVIFWEMGMNAPLLPVKGLIQRINVAAGDLWVILACASALKSSNTSLKPSLN
ncbi:DUF998 domain-containing protein [Robertkochia flava]|uniref:DUF998 domain-containing protein n=1 Tax=Robertkochia flava TaxID=3447986 RepID=UPI001CC9B75C|nr:DUF998 domain-containing protein [Robertkochia marina]